MTTDEELKERICNALLRDERLSEQAINVGVQDGIVKLAGAVQSHRRKIAAQELATTFDGCRDVINQLDVEPPGLASDEEIAHNVRAALTAHADITKEAITVSVNRGTVVLMGQVQKNWERLTAEDVALSVCGVRKVENGLLVDPMGLVEDEAMSYEISEALKSARGLRDTDIEVAVSGDHVVLSGAVQALWQKETALLVASRFPIRTVRNDINVTGS